MDRKGRKHSHHRNRHDHGSDNHLQQGGIRGCASFCYDAFHPRKAGHGVRVHAVCPNARLTSWMPIPGTEAPGIRITATAERPQPQRLVLDRRQHRLQHDARQLQDARRKPGSVEAMAMRFSLAQCPHHRTGLDGVRRGSPPTFQKVATSSEPRRRIRTLALGRAHGIRNARQSSDERHHDQHLEEGPTPEEEGVGDGDGDRKRNLRLRCWMSCKEIAPRPPFPSPIPHPPIPRFNGFAN